MLRQAVDNPCLQVVSPHCRYREPPARALNGLKMVFAYSAQPPPGEKCIAVGQPVPTEPGGERCESVEDSIPGLESSTVVSPSSTRTQLPEVRATETPWSQRTDHQQGLGITGLF